MPHNQVHGCTLGMLDYTLSNAVTITLCHCTIFTCTMFVQSVKNLAWSMFYCNLVLPELDKIQTIKELLCVKICLLYTSDAADE